MVRGLRIVANTNSPGVLPLYSGLRSFCRRRSIQLSYSPVGKVEFRESGPGVLCVELDVEFDGMPDLRTLCFDMHDSGVRYFREHLEQCDFYFKRSFDTVDVARLPAALARKMKPYGLFYRFADAADTSLPRRIWCEVRARKRTGRPIGRAELSWWMLLAGSSWLYSVSPRTIKNKLVLPERLLTRSAGGLGSGVCFQTRVWAPDEAPDEKDLANINETRAETVRALRRYFGARFVGGLMRNRYAEERYPDLITPYPEDRLSYLGLLQRSRVSIVTSGIHGSIPGKVAESLAAGRCIVTEPLQYDLPVPLQTGVHCLLFRSPAQCVESCERLLNDDALAAAMQRANRTYYVQHASAEAAVARCLSLVQHVMCHEDTSA